MRRTVRIAAAVFALFAATPAVAAEAVAIDGDVGHPRQWTVDDLQGLPPVKVRVAYSSDHGDAESVYTGALLWSVISQAAPVDGPGKGAFLRRVILVTGDDGYAVAVASGEIDPDFENKQVLIAYAIDGKPIPQGLRLVVPGDKRAGRSVRDVARITVTGLGARPKPAAPGPSAETPPVTHFPP